jgi:hypothetical protein
MSSGNTCSKFLKIENKNCPAWKKFGSGGLSVTITMPCKSTAPWAKGQCDSLRQYPFMKYLINQNGTLHNWVLNIDTGLTGGGT